MALLGTGVLAVWNDVAALAEADFNTWYDRQHLEERASIKGFIRGRRYRAEAGPHKYCAVYETESPGVLFSPAYRARLDSPTPWTRRVMGAFGNTVRTVCRVAATEGTADGGALTSALFVAPPRNRCALGEWLRDVALPALVERAGVDAVHVLERFERDEVGPSREAKLRQGPDRTVDLALLIEGESEAAVEAAYGSVVAPRLLDFPAAGPFSKNRYRLICECIHGGTTRGH